MNKREQWEKIKTEWPDLAELLKQLKDAGMKADSVEAQSWPQSQKTGSYRGGR